MKRMTAATIGKLIEAHKNQDEEKFEAYANFIAECYEDSGDTLGAKIIRDRLNGIKGTPITLDDGLNEIENAIDTERNKQKEFRISKLNEVKDKIQKKFPEKCELKVRNDYELEIKVIAKDDEGNKHKCRVGSIYCYNNGELYYEAGASLIALMDLKTDEDVYKYIESQIEWFKKSVNNIY